MRKSLIVTLASIAVATLLLPGCQLIISQTSAKDQSEYSAAVIDQGRGLAGLGNCAVCYIALLQNMDRLAEPHYSPADETLSFFNINSNLSFSCSLAIFFCSRTSSLVYSALCSMR